MNGFECVCLHIRNPINVILIIPAAFASLLTELQEKHHNNQQPKPTPARAYQSSQLDCGIAKAGVQRLRPYRPVVRPAKSERLLRCVASTRSTRMCFQRMNFGTRTLFQKSMYWLCWMFVLSQCFHSAYNTRLHMIYIGCRIVAQARSGGNDYSHAQMRD